MIANRSSFRSLKNDIVRLGPDLAKSIHGNYVGKEQLFSFGYSYLVPKVSPIKVIYAEFTSILGIETIDLDQFTGGNQHGYGLVQSYGDF